MRPGTKNRLWSFLGVFVSAVIAIALIIAVSSNPAEAQKKASKHKAYSQKTYASPEEAVKAIVDAARANDMTALLAIMGRGGKAVLSSGDEVADKEGRAALLKAYEEKKRIETEGDTKAIVYIGKDDWPFPIPIVKKGEYWLFDTKAGKEEILNRRIGKNELNAIQVCLAYVDAQREYAIKDHDSDGLLEYAQKFASDPGKKNGLYWKTGEGEQPSPLGPLVAKAKREGYSKMKPTEEPSPYYGYYYRILTGQGKNAQGGAYDYVVKGKMIGGFALVAYPAKYGNSGVMTFMVNQDGVVYEKNLGKNTLKKAEEVKVFDPDKTWRKVEAQ